MLYTSQPMADRECPRMPSPISENIRPRVRGKFIFIGDEKLYIRGVTYGTFRSDEDGNEYHNPLVVEHDFAQMAANGINAVRTYTVPPRWLLDVAQRHSLRVMVGLPWEQHVAFLEGKVRVQSIEQRVREGVRACAGHPAVLCYTIGNEIPASLVRWYGRHQVGRFLKQLYQVAKSEDPDGLVTYVNYPTTEYLHLPFVDLVCFNVYLEQQEQFEAYLARLQNIAGDRPLVMAEIGLDSRRNSKQVQAHVLDWQIRTTFAAGCAGAFVFAWTDEWYRGGYDIDDWDFGITDRRRRAKPALAAVREAFAAVPFPQDLAWPSISVVVCTYNGARTIRDCLAGLMQLEYPNFEVIVVNDGSTDRTAEIAAEYDVRLISTSNQGLSSARNTGLHAARGEIVAYIDDDARPDPHWLTYLAATLMNKSHVGVGGPNIPPPGDGLIAECVANAPGGPTHVLVSDQEAEHIPGCNMAFKKAYLEAIGGFDAQFRVAGDDVDLCWRVQQQGWTLGFNPVAVVWHHRRNSVRTYWKQQQGYGKAEAFLERKWPEKYNAAGYLTWVGRIYGQEVMQVFGWRQEHIDYGTWGTNLFQSVYQPAAGVLGSLPLMPEWYLVILALAGLAILGLSWMPLLFTLPLLVLAVGASVVQAGVGAARASFTSTPQTQLDALMLRSLTFFLHLIQPLARLLGRLRSGLTPWRWRGASGLARPWPRTSSIWSERWQEPKAWLHSLEVELQRSGVCVVRGGDYDRWDLEVQGGVLGATRILMATEEHGGGKQFLRLRLWPRCTVLGIVLPLLFAVLATLARLDEAWTSAVILGILSVVFALRMLQECSGTAATILHVLARARIGGV